MTLPRFGITLSRGLIRPTGKSAQPLQSGGKNPAVDLLWICSDSFGYIEGVVPALDKLQMPRSGETREDVLQQFEVTEPVPCSGEEQHRSPDIIQVLIPQVVFLARRM